VAPTTWLVSDAMDAVSGQAPPESRPRQARAESTRLALITAAARRFAAAGYEGTSLRQILQDAGLTKGALYFHFADKQALADAVIAETIAIWRRNAEAVQALNLDPLSAIVVSFERVAELMLSDPVAGSGMHLLNDPMLSTRAAVEHYGWAEDATRELLLAARACGLLRPAVDVALLARTIVTLVAGHNIVTERTGTRDELPARIAGMWDALLPVVASDEWLQAYRGASSTAHASP
jgi:AcrR family transcriptional regulator